MDKSINRLLDKIEFLEKELEKEKKNNFNKFSQAIEKMTFKGILIEEMYDFWVSTHQMKGK